MPCHRVSLERFSITLATLVAAGLLRAGAPAAIAAGLPVTPSTTQEWGSEVVRVTADSPGTVAVGPDGATMESGSGSGGGSGTSAWRGGAGAAPADTDAATDYCLELDLADASSGPYRLRFHFDTSGGSSTSRANRARGAAPAAAPGPAARTAAATGAIAPRRAPASPAARRRRRVSPLDTSLSLSFALATTADASALTTGDLGLVAAIYDADDNLVAADDGAGGRISATLPAGSYTLVISGGDQLAGSSAVMADSGTCSGD